MTISLTMVLPGLAGRWIDSRLGTEVVFMLIGFAIGSFVAMRQLMGIARSTSPAAKASTRQDGKENDQ